MDIVLIVILAIVIIQFIAMLSLFSKHRHSLQVEVSEFMRRLEKNETSLLDEFGKNREETNKSVKDSIEELSSSLKSVSEQLPTVITNFSGLVDNKMNGIQGFVDSSLKSNRDELSAALKEFEEKFSAKIEALAKDMNDGLGKTYDSVNKITDTQQGNGKKLDEIAQAMDSGLKSHHDELLESLKTLEVKSLTKIELLAKNTNDGLEKTRDSFEKKLTDTQQGNEKKLDEIMQTMDSSLKFHREGLSISLKGFEDRFSARIETIINTVEKKINEMSQIVGENLHTILETQLGESFKHISEKLELVQKGLGEKQTLTNEVVNIKNVLLKTKEKLNTALSEIENAGTQAREIEKKLQDVQTLPEEKAQEALSDVATSTDAGAPVDADVAMDTDVSVPADMDESVAADADVSAPADTDESVAADIDVSAPVDTDESVAAAADADVSVPIDADVNEDDAEQIVT